MSTSISEELIGQAFCNDYRILRAREQASWCASFEATGPMGESLVARVLLGVSDVAIAPRSLLEQAQAIARHSLGLQGLTKLRAAAWLATSEGIRLVVAHELPKPLAETPGRSVPQDALQRLFPVAHALRSLHDQGLSHGALCPQCLSDSGQGAVLSGYGIRDLLFDAGSQQLSAWIEPDHRLSVCAPTDPRAPQHDVAGLANCLLWWIGAPSSGDVENRLRTLGLSPSAVLVRSLEEALQGPFTTRPLDPVDFIEGLLKIPWESTLEAASGPNDAYVETPEPIQDSPSGGSAPPVEGDEPSVSTEQATEAPPTQELGTGVMRNPAPEPRSSPRSGLNIVPIVLVLLGVMIVLAGGLGVFLYAVVGSRSPIPANVDGGVVSDAGGVDAEPLDALDVDSTPGAQREDASVVVTPLPVFSPGETSYPEDQLALLPLPARGVVIGTRQAKVTLVLFADPHCPATKSVWRSILTAWDNHGEELRVAVRFLQMPSLSGSAQTSAAALAVFETAGPEAFSRFLVAASGAPSPATGETLGIWIQRSGASSILVNKAVGPELMKALQVDEQLAGQLMVRASPTVFVNGWKLQGVPSEAVLQAEIKRQLRLAEGGLRSGLLPSELYQTQVKFNMTAPSADLHLRQ